MSMQYGEWPSPIDSVDVAEGGRDFASVYLDGDVYWLEHRPSEDGRGVVVRDGPDGPTDVTPEGYNVRTLAQHNGGGDALVEDGTVWFANFDDQRLYRQPVGGDPEPITPEPPSERAHRYADLVRSPDGERVYAVRERLRDGGAEPRTELVRVPASGGTPTVIAEGHDFYAAPRLAPDGERLSYLRWNHPQMPWDGTELVVADVTDDGSLDGRAVVLGGETESVVSPQWGDDGTLYAVSDRTDWWNLYGLGTEPRADEATNLLPAAVEFGVPQWQFGVSTYAVLDDGTIATVVTDDGRGSLRLLDPDAGTLTESDLPYTTYRPLRVRSDGERVAFVGGRPTAPTEVATWVPGEEPVVHRTSAAIDVDEAYFSVPETVTFPTGDAVGSDETVAHAHYYPPANPEVEAASDETPPVVVTAHGGPTGHAEPTLSLRTQFFTTRGIGVLDVNYRGSTGYGRTYRDALRGEWGVRDALDCVNAARYAANRGWADPDRLAISGESSGGYTALAALAFYETFDAGTSYYGITDLEAWGDETHKFESRYLDGLVGPLPDAAETYHERSPVHHADDVTAPLLLLQGTDDEVVPPAQARAMVDGLDERDAPYAYVEFAGEHHGFRKPENVARAIEAEFDFYATVFGFDPDDDLEGVTMGETEYSSG